jgi:transcriptional regulator with XRE-family HTH domain
MADNPKKRKNLVIKFQKQGLKKVFSAIEAGFGLTEKELSEVLGVTPRTLNNWMNGNGAVNLKLIYIQRIFDLEGVAILGLIAFRGGNFQKWLRSQPLAYDKTPLECLKRGEYERIRHSLSVINSSSCA